jgi:hypothetical protein
MALIAVAASPDDVLGPGARVHEGRRASREPDDEPRPAAELEGRREHGRDGRKLGQAVLLPDQADRRHSQVDALIRPALRNTLAMPTRKSK